MKYLVLSREKAKEYCNHINEPTAIISITFHGRTFPKFVENENIKDILYERFDDVSGGHDGCMELWQASEICDFVNEVKDKVNLLIVHCDAGQSRSAGVCAAIMKYLEGDDSPIFNNPKFTPNSHCYNLVLGELMCC